MLAVTIEWEPAESSIQTYGAVVGYITILLEVTQDFVMKLWHL